MTNDNTKRLKQLKLALESGIIDEDTFRASVAALGGGATTNQAIAQDAGSVAQSGGVAAHNIAVGKDVNGNVININVNAANLAPDRLWRLIGKQLPSPDLKKVTAQFLQTLVDRYRYLDFRGMGVSDRIPLQLPLLEMYIPLKARAQMPEGETWARELRLAGRAPSEAEAEAMGQRLSEPQPVLDLLTKHDGLIILGDPGSGKTTFLKFLALALATGQGEALGLGTRLPVLLPLSAYASALATGDISLDRFISAYYQDRGVALPVEAMLDEALAQGGTLLLLDGLDEVKEVGQRHLVVDRVTDFYSFHRRAGNKFVLTSRLVGYPEVRPRVEGLAEATLVDLEDEDIEEFVDKWTTTLEKAARGSTQVAAFEAERERDELLSAVHQNPGVRSLAANPLLLTILALMKRQGVELPERRVELYQAYVETLLKHWNLARSLAGRAGRDLDVVETLRILAPLALWIHRSSPGVGLVKEGDLRRELQSIFKERGHEEAEYEAREFLDDVRNISSLLIDRGGRQYGFIHLTFQEYLAGVALAHKGQRDIEPIVDELADHIDDDTWREVSLLTVGFLGIVQQRDEAAAAVVEGLIERAPGEPGQAVVLAGEAVADAGAGGVTPRCRSKVIETLLQKLRDDDRVKPTLRAECGRILAGVGDPRPEVMTLDAMRFCYISAGPLLMGSADDDEMAYDNEKRQHEYNVDYDYWIARYPVTVAQYQAYIEAIGKDPRDELSLLRGPSNHPVVNVDWHEATNFCEWLTEHWRARGTLVPGLAVRLPSEPEWEKAARGGIQTPTSPHVGQFSDIKVPDFLTNPNAGRRYPWGDDPDPNRANYSDSEILTTNTVGSFCSGVSPYGCEEMTGNVLEWTRSIYAEYPYPDNREGRLKREDTAAKAPRVLRGGSFYNDRFLVRCAFRDWNNPDFRSHLFGFRVVVSPFVSGR